MVFLMVCSEQDVEKQLGNWHVRKGAALPCSCGLDYRVVEFLNNFGLFHMNYIVDTDSDAL